MLRPPALQPCLGRSLCKTVRQRLESYVRSWYTLPTSIKRLAIDCGDFPGKVR